MNKVKTSFYKRSIPDKIQKGYSILEAMEGNAHFPAPLPKLEVFAEALKTLEQTHREAQYGDKVKRGFMFIAEQAVDTMIVSLAAYVQSASGGDAGIILSSGFELRSARSAPQSAGQPSAPKGKPGTHDGDIVLSWPKVPGARTYLTQVSEDGGETWADCGTSTRCRHIVTDLPSGSKPLFRVAAFGINGQSAWSDAGQGKVA